jgi:tetratricopeptide (TPR) repeat protein
MRLDARRLYSAAALLAAVFATAVSVRSWLGERSFAQGTSAQRRGDFSAADASYRAASGHGNADAAVARARLALLRRDWAGAADALREALALAPTRGLPHLLQATLELDRPGPWDGAREERILAGCRSAVALEPVRGTTWSGSAGALLRMALLRRALWDPARTRTVIAEAADGFAEALALDPGTARQLFVRILDEGGDPVLLLEVASRRSAAASFTALVELLLDRSRWAGAEPGLWAAAESRGVLPAYAAAVSGVLARRALVREALAAARRGLLAAPGDPKLSVRAADSAARLPGPEALAAVPLYRAAVAAAPADLDVRKRFAGFLAARGLLGEAEGEARAVVAADAKDAGAWFLLGEIVGRSGRSGEAAAAFREAAALRPENATYRRAAAGGQR